MKKKTERVGLGREKEENLENRKENQNSSLWDRKMVTQKED